MGEHDFISYADLMKAQTREIKTSVDGLQETMEYKRIKAPVKPHVDYDFEVLRERHTNLMAKKAKAAAEEETTKTVVSSKLQSGDDDLLRPINLQSWKYEGQQQDLSATTTTSTRKTTTTELDEDEQLLQPFVYERKTLKMEEEEESDGEYEMRKLGPSLARRETTSRKNQSPDQPITNTKSLCVHSRLPRRPGDVLQVLQCPHLKRRKNITHPDHKERAENQEL